MQRNSLLTIGAVIAAGILAFGLLATVAQQWSQTATADHAEILSIDTLPLEGLSLDAGEFLLLADTTPALIESGHVAMNVPCSPDDDTPQTDIAVVAGVAPDVSPLESEFVADLSNPDDNKCTFHVSFPEDDEDITDVAIINTGDATVEFESGNFATVSLTTTNGHDDENVEEREFRADLSGENEVPAVDTEASGEFEMVLDEDGETVEYELTVEDIEGVTAAHIHMGSEGENGDIVVPLETDGLNDGETAEGTFDADDFEGPLDGQEMSDLIQLIEDGEAYVNVHTEENPDGEIRGQLEEQ
jgi:hypothetical protein